MPSFARFDVKMEKSRIESNWAQEVGAYAEKDAELTFKLWQHVKKLMIEQDLQDIFNLETDLFPCLVDMRFLGVRVDMPQARRLSGRWCTGRY